MGISPPPEAKRVIVAAILTLSLEVRMASGKESDVKIWAEGIQKNWQHFAAAMAVAYDLGERSKRKKRS